MASQPLARLVPPSARALFLSHTHIHSTTRARNPSLPSIDRSPSPEEACGGGRHAPRTSCMRTTGGGQQRKRKTVSSSAPSGRRRNRPADPARSRNKSRPPPPAIDRTRKFRPGSMEPRREAVLRELGDAWDEIGEAEADRREALRALEEGCLALYRAELARLRQRTARLRRDVADAVAELAAIRAALGDTVQSSSANSSGGGRSRSLSLKEELGAIAPELEEMRRRRDERRRLFQEVTDVIDRIEQEMYSTNSNAAADDDGDLTMSKLQELRSRLGDLQSEKENRIKKVAELTSSLHSSSLVLGMDSGETDLEEGDISDCRIARLLSEIEHLREIKRDRMQKLQDLVAAMFELWNLMDTPPEEQSRFQDVACNIAASEEEITEPGALSVGFIANVEAEVVRLESLKERRMKDLLLKKRDELREIRRRTRIAAAEEDDDDGDGGGGGALLVFDAINDDTERSMILERLEAQISEAKDEEFSRKEVLERMEKWQAALEEESWLEEYNRNENRYSVGKGMHLMLKRAEKARALVNKMPAMAEALIAKVLAWEKERGEKFEYDGEGLLDMLEEYDNTRKEKEHERKRQRDQRKSQGQNRVESPVARALPKSIKNVTRTLSMGRSGSRKVAVSSSSPLSSSRPTTPSFLKSPMSPRGSDDGQMMASGPFD
ncbi:hypothetical protein BRADI_3g02590v3 [Brachypodium distachyon]|uniref:Uncharacterized protein n=2 Tax=Brachypodium distachyon TaxID=15368 RepID=A0A0Q3J3Z0_BRADI|nr:hypothetical protein BRADI_3g02590v3 [Brachypodium distachyon]